MNHQNHHAQHETMEVDTAERLTQLLIGAICIISLIVFGILDSVYGYGISDRLFWVLFITGSSALGLEKVIDILRRVAAAWARSEASSSERYDDK